MHISVGLQEAERHVYGRGVLSASVIIINHHQLNF